MKMSPESSMTRGIHLLSFPRRLSPCPNAIQLQYKYNTKSTQNTIVKIQHKHDLHKKYNYKENSIKIQHVSLVICPHVLMSKCSFPLPSFVQTQKVTTTKPENHISTEMLKLDIKEETGCEAGSICLKRC